MHQPLETFLGADRLYVSNAGTLCSWSFASPAFDRSLGTSSLCSLADGYLNINKQWWGAVVRAIDTGSCCDSWWDLIEIDYSSKACGKVRVPPAAKILFVKHVPHARIWTGPLFSLGWVWIWKLMCTKAVVVGRVWNMMLTYACVHILHVSICACTYMYVVHWHMYIVVWIYWLNHYWAYVIVPLERGL